MTTRIRRLPAAYRLLAAILCADMAESRKAHPASSGESGTADPSGAPAVSQLSTTSDQEAGLQDATAEAGGLSHRWAVSFGVGIISDDTVSDYSKLDFDRLGGDGGGVTYNITVTYSLREFEWQAFGKTLRPRLEIPGMLTLVDDKIEGVIPDFNVGLVFRWTDFPWNRYLKNSFAAGAGLSYAPQIWTADKQRHRGEDRSELKFWLPIDFTFALPRWPQYEVFLFIDHQSGGHIFDRGGVDAWGAGCRFRF